MAYFVLLLLRYYTLTYSLTIEFWQVQLDGDCTFIIGISVGCALSLENFCQLLAAYLSLVILFHNFTLVQTYLLYARRWIPNSQRCQSNMALITY